MVYVICLELHSALLTITLPSTLRLSATQDFNVYKFKCAAGKYGTLWLHLDKLWFSLSKLQFAFMTECYQSH